MRRTPPGEPLDGEGHPGVYRMPRDRANRASPTAPGSYVPHEEAHP